MVLCHLTVSSAVHCDIKRSNVRSRLHRLPPDTPPSYSGNRIGLFGGTFNPPHEGHVDAAMTALKRLKLDRLWWMVTPGNPLKTCDHLASVQDRLAQCRALVDDRRIIVTGFEQHLPDAFTANTIGRLRAQRPTTQFVWIMGGDGLVNFHHWHDWQAIIDTVPIAVIDRPGWRLPALSSKTAHAFAERRFPETHATLLAHCQPPAWTYLTAPQNAVSSTELRQNQDL